MTVCLHFYTSLMTILLPFKLGELVRIYEVGKSEKNYLKGAVVVWVERAFDSLFLVLLIVFALISHHISAQEIYGLLTVMIFFVLISVLFFSFVPDQVININSHIIKHYPARRALKPLMFLEKLRNVASTLSEVITNKIMIVLFTSLVIWLCEVMSLVYLYQSDFGQGVSAILLNFSNIVSSNVSDFSSSRFTIYYIVSLILSIAYWSQRIKKMSHKGQI